MQDTGSLRMKKHETNKIPHIVAHRGFSYAAPENTLAAYQMAMDAGAEMAECDVHLSQDGVAVLLHDDTVDRTTNGTGLASDKSLAELQSLDAGGWQDPAFAGERIPTLAEALGFVRGKMRFIIELKGDAMGPAVLSAMREVGSSPDDVLIISFYYTAIRNIRALDNRLPAAWLWEVLPENESDRETLFQRALQASVEGVGLPSQYVDQRFVDSAHERGLQVFVFTVNEAEEMRRIAALGVDALITDRPDLAQRTLQA